MNMCLKEIINCDVWYIELLRVSFQLRTLGYVTTEFLGKQVLSLDSSCEYH
jgi:hypothetical protein